MSQAAQLRQKAALHRRAASIPTEGSHATDRLLIALAKDLEREAEALEAVGEEDTDQSSAGDRNHS
jgi:hypothetical protein